MVELSWQAALVWFGVLAGAASVAGLVMAVVSGRQTTRLQAGIHAATQLTLTDLRKGWSSSQQVLGEAIIGLGQILERMDLRADERHCETLQVLERLGR